MRSPRPLLVVALGLGVLTGASECHGQSKPATVSIAADGEAKVSYDPATKVLTVTPAIAVIVKESDFKWQVGKLPDRHTIEIDFRVHDGRKGPFKRSAEGTTGRYKGGSDSEVKAGAVDYKGRDAWKYDVILRDGAGNDVAAIDPMVIIAQ